MCCIKHENRTKMICRRKFIQQTTLSTLAVALAEIPTLALAAKQRLKSIGLITGVIQAEIKNDWEQTLRKVANIGYTHLEFGKYFGNDINAFKKVLNETGLKPLAGGASMAQMRKEDELKKMIGEALQLDKKYLVCYWPWMDGGNNKKLDDFKKASDDLNWVGEVCNKAGIRFAFHNHDKEFVPVDGYQWGYDTLLKETDPEKVCMLLDLYWCAKGGGDAIEIMQKNPGRIEMFHVKDMDNTPQQLYTCPGYGTIDFKKIFAQSIKSNVKHYTVEIDSHSRPMQCIEDSYKYLKALRF